MKFNKTKAKVLTRGVPPDSFLFELVKWAQSASEDIFSRRDNPHPGKPDPDVYTSVFTELGPYTSLIYRRAVMCEVLRVLAGFESSWNPNEGRDIKNTPAGSPQDEIEAGWFQVSANSRAFGQDLRDISPRDPVEFQRVMKANHPLAFEYAARLLRHTCAHNGPVKRKEINEFLKREAVAEFVQILSNPIPEQLVG